MQNPPQASSPRHRFTNTLQRVLSHRSVPIAAALLGVLLGLPALGNGFTFDDYYHRTVLLGNSRFRSLLGPPEEMFRFFRGDPARAKRAMDLGLLPWWTDPTLKAEFLQWLTVQTHRLDYALWPNSPALMHAQSLAWYALLVGLTACLYRRMFGPTWVAGLAALLFAIDDAHGTPVGWIANRNSLVATSFGVLTLLAHDAWRRGGRRAALPVAVALLFTSLMAKEEGLSTCAYLFAYAVFVDPAGWRKGCGALAPYALAVIVWRALRAHWGYGVMNMGLYIDPMTDPARFATALWERAPILLLGQWGEPPANLAALLNPAGLAAMWWLAVVYLSVLAIVAVPLLRRDALARFWAAGSVLAVVPVCATLPMDRLLTFTGIGSFGLLAQLFAFVFGPREAQPASRAWRVLALAMGCLLVVVHLVIAPLALSFWAGNPLGPRAIDESLYIPPELGPESEAQTVVVVDAPSVVHASYLPVRRELAGLPVPRHTRVLAPGMPSVTVRREDERTLVVRPERGYLNLAPDRLFRSEHRPLGVGYRVDLTGMTAEVTALTRDGRPAEARFRFSVPLEDPSLLWICYRDHHYERFTPPPLGQQEVIHAGKLFGRD